MLEMQSGSILHSDRNEWVLILNTLSQPILGTYLLFTFQKDGKKQQQGFDTVIIQTQSSFYITRVKCKKEKQPQKKLRQCYAKCCHKNPRRGVSKGHSSNLSQVSDHSILSCSYRKMSKLPKLKKKKKKTKKTKKNPTSKIKSKTHTCTNTRTTTG